MPEQLRNIAIRSNGEEYVLTLYRQDWSAVYPGMIRYLLRVMSGDREVASVSTNSYEYPPEGALDAESAALRIADQWEDGLRTDPGEFLASVQSPVHGRKGEAAPAMVVLQGSPRAAGNCSILSGWAVEAARDAGRTAEVIFPHDMGISPCIGCYQCYNTGSCSIQDEMTDIIRSVAACRLLLVCSPVYTNSVPGSLKILVDRFQAYHAERTLFGGPTGQKGLVFSVAGRKGMDNFTCVTGVLDAFMRNIGIKPCGELLIDGMDRLRDIRAVPGIEERVRSLVRECLDKGK